VKVCLFLSKKSILTLPKGATHFTPSTPQYLVLSTLKDKVFFLIFLPFDISAIISSTSKIKRRRV